MNFADTGRQSELSKFLCILTEYAQRQNRYFNCCSYPFNKSQNYLILTDSFLCLSWGQMQLKDKFMSKLYFGLVVAVFSLFFQNAFAGKPARRAEIDSVHKANIVRRHAVADSIKRHVIPAVFSLEYADSMLQQIEHLHTTLNDITNESKYAFKTDQVEKELKEMQSGIRVISQSLARDSTVLNLNNLQMFRGLLKDMEEQLHEWRDVLYQDNKDLSNMSAEMNVFVQDSFTQKVAADTAFANLHLDELIIVNDRWKEAQTTTKANLDHIGKLQAAVSTSYFDVTELQNKVRNQLAGTAIKTFGKEYNYIWNMHSALSLNEVSAYTVESLQERMKTLRYYLILNVEDWLFPLLAGLVFFFWVVWNFRRIKGNGLTLGGEDLAFKYLHPIPILGTLIFILNVAPFYSFDQPALYVEILQLLILIPLTIIFWQNWSRQLFVYWCLLVALYLSTSVMNAIITPGWPLRLFLLGLDLVSVIFGFFFLRVYNKTLPLGRSVKFIAILYIVMNATAVIANTAGRLTLAKILTSAAVIGLTQIAALFVFVPMLTEAFYLQMKSSRISGGMAGKFSYEEIRKGLYRLFAIAATILWLVTFATNLEIYNAVVSFLDGIVNTSRTIGSATFTVENILAFIFILYIASILQKYIGNFFGETEEDFSGNLDKRESRLVIFRLVIIMGGFFIAVIASGLPVDKVTVVLGALGVGIGLGLQNIVYNLVSGVILIFEKPMQIGDYIEVADKKGRVQNIGIRSSKLITTDGSEVIVPNGDILSSHMVNWTRSNNNRRSQLSITIEPASELEAAKETILEELKGNPHVIQDRPVEILLSNLSEKSVVMSINVWINSIYKEQQFKSEALSNIYARLAKKGIKIV